MDNLKRIQHVVRVLEKHGLAAPLNKIGMPHHLSFARRHVQGSCSNIPLALRTACEELGGVFIRLILFLCSRPDLVPLAYVKEFSKAKDKQKPLAFKIISSIIKEECGAVFEFLDPVAFSSTSITQSYRARLKNHDEVVVKVVRPGMQELLAQDMPVLQYAAAKLQKTIPWHWSVILDEFEEQLRIETNLLEYAKQWECRVDPVVMPKIMWDQSTSRVLVRQFLPGKLLIHAQPQTKQVVTRVLAECVLAGKIPLRTQEHVLIMPHGKIACISRFFILTKKQSDEFRAIMASIQHRQPLSLRQSLSRAGIVTEQTRTVELQEHLESLLSNAPSEVQALGCALDVCQVHAVALPGWLGQASASMNGIHALFEEKQTQCVSNKLSFAFLAGACLIVAAVLINQGPVMYTLPVVSVLALAGGIVFTLLLFKEMYTGAALNS